MISGFSLELQVQSEIVNPVPEGVSYYLKNDSLIVFTNDQIIKVDSLNMNHELLVDFTDKKNNDIPKNHKYDLFSNFSIQGSKILLLRTNTSWGNNLFLYDLETGHLSLLNSIEDENINEVGRVSIRDAILVNENTILYETQDSNTFINSINVFDIKKNQKKTLISGIDISSIHLTERLDELFLKGIIVYKEGGEVVLYNYLTNNKFTSKEYGLMVFLDNSSFFLFKEGSIELHDIIDNSLISSVVFNDYFNYINSYYIDNKLIIVVKNNMTLKFLELEISNGK